MAIQTSYNFYIKVNSIDLSDHCVSLKVNMPQNANEVQAAGDTHKKYRAGMGDPSIEATFRADDTTSGPGYVVRQLVTPTSTGFPVAARRLNTTVSSANPEYSAVMVVSGDVPVMDDAWGEVPTFSVKFVPFGTFSVASSS